MRKEQTGYTRHRKIGAVIGDSIVHSYTTNTRSYQFWPTQLEAKLAARGIRCKVRNLGLSGNTSAQSHFRRSALVLPTVPEFALIAIGVNDPADTGTVQASPAPTATVFTVDDASDFKVGAYINVNNTTHNAGAGACKISAIAGAQITLESALPSVPTAGQLVRCDTYANICSMIDHCVAAGVPLIGVVGAHFLNFATGGDTVSVDYAAYVPVRAAQLAAATAKNVLFVDVHAYMKAYLVANPASQGVDALWQTTTGNQHPNPAGSVMIASAVDAAIGANAAWITELTE